MRLERLHLKAFGTFRDRVIELPAGASHDFHAVYGPNEAGKSTVLRAVTGFLFGIPERTTDAFLHDYNALRVGASLRLGDGTRLSAMRRKGRKSTLFALDEATGAEITDRPLPERTAADLTGGLDLALYQNLFGLDLPGLVSGSEALLQGEGEIGRSLFQAAAGLASLRTVMSDLESQAAESFKPRGKNARLNEALDLFKEQMRIAREAAVRAPAWEQVEREFRDAEAAHAQLRERLREARIGQERLLRIRGNLPLLAERTQKQAEVASLAHLPVLPADAPQRRATAQERLRQAQALMHAAQERVTQLQAAGQRLSVREGVLAQAGGIEQAYHALTYYHQAREALPQLTRERSKRLEGIGALREELGHLGDPATASEWLPSETLIARVKSLMEEHEHLAARQEPLDSQSRTKELAIQRLCEQREELPEAIRLEELEPGVASSANLADLEARSRALAADVLDEAGRLQRENTALWPGTLPDLLSLTVPLAGAVTAFERELTDLAQEERIVSEQDSTLTRELGEHRRDLGVLTAGGETVTQADVDAARATRDRRWAQLRRVVIDGLPLVPKDQADLRQAGIKASAGPLAMAFEGALREADRLADLLRSDTERATRLTTARRQIADREAGLARNEAQRTKLATRREDVQRRWAALLAPLRRSDLSPTALREWISRHQRLVEAHRGLNRMRAQQSQLGTEISRDRDLLQAALVACGLSGIGPDETSISALLRARQALEEARRIRTESETLSRQIQAGRNELADLRSQSEHLSGRLGGWMSRWREISQSLRLAPDALPAEARTRLEQYGRLSEALGELTELARQIQEQQSVVTSFEAQVAELTRAAGEASAGDPAPDTLAERLYEALNDARRAEAAARQIASDLARERGVIADGEANVCAARGTLEELLRQAGCRSPEELPQIEQQSARSLALRQRLQEIDAQLMQQNGRSVEEVVEEAGTWPIEGAEHQIAAAATAIEQLEGQVEAAQQVLFGAKQRRDAIDGGTVAAEAQQASQSLVARIAKEARAYARARLAQEVLGRVVQRYREQHQGPMLRRSADVFARITCGRFSGLTVDHEEDRQVLLGVRPDKSRVPVLGMSQGTRDQLFLSLRLAAIEQHIESRGPFPVIVDDLLVQFDDERSLATLEALAELSRRTQVLFFTHHRHLVELARASKLAPLLSVQNL